MGSYLCDNENSDMPFVRLCWSFGFKSIAQEVFWMTLLYEVCLYSLNISFTRTTAYLVCFILGNDVIYTLTKERTSALYVRVKFQYHMDDWYQIYGQFSVSDEGSNYTLSLEDPGNGTLGIIYNRCIILLFYRNITQKIF